MKADVVVIGCGVIGAAIAYQIALSGQSVIVVEAKDPAREATGAALGILMGVASQRTTGDALELRLKSSSLFEPWITQIESDIHRSLPVNRNGILHILDPGELSDWQDTLEHRKAAGYRLDYCVQDQIRTLQPGLRPEIRDAIYSPQDRQLSPQVLTHALIQAARQRGVQFFFHQPITQVKTIPGRVNALYTSDYTISPGLVIVSAGLGSSPLSELLGLRIPLQAVKGQALRVYTSAISLGPVVTEKDFYLVPLPDGSIGIGATVEFQAHNSQPTLQGIQSLLTQAIHLCPALAQAEILSTWSGSRPRPTSQRAPILGCVPSYSNLMVATGHYRNGVLLAPITAQIMADLVVSGQTSLCDLEKFSPRDLENLSPQGLVCLD
jgi:glycine oxidase ThiO